MQERHKFIEGNSWIVKAVISDKVNDPHKNGFFTYDDIVQIGYVGLCKAAIGFKPAGKAKFETYAYTAIRNEIYNALEYATIRKNKTSSEDIETVLKKASLNNIHFEPKIDIESIIYKIKQKATGVTAKGIDALILMSKGYSCKDIGKIYGVSANNISAWISKARKFLLKEPAILALKLSI